MSATDLLALYVLVGFVLTGNAAWAMHRDEACRKELMASMRPILNHPRVSPPIAALILAFLTLLVMTGFVVAWPFMAVVSYRRNRK